MVRIELSEVLLGFFDIATNIVVLFFVFLHLFEECLQDLALGHIERLVVVRVGTQRTLLALLTLLFSLSFLGRHFVRLKFNQFNNYN